MNAKVIFSGAIIFFIGNVLSSILGMVREVLLAAHYGTGIDMDAYLFAYTIPAFILAFWSMFFTSVFIPIYIKHRVDEGPESASKLYSNTLNWSFILILLVMGLCFAFGNPLSGLFATSALSHYKIEHMLWILIPSIFFFSLSFAQISVLNSINKFTVSAFVTAINNVAMIAVMLLLHRAIGIYSVALGFTIGTVVQVLIQLPSMRKHKLRYHFRLKLRDETVRRMFIMALPVIGLVVIDQCTTFATRYLSANLAEGTASALNYANRLSLLPITLFGTSIVTSTFPSVMQLFAENRRQEHNRLLSTTVKSLLLILLPITVLSMVFAVPIIKAVLERGVFDAQATAMTASAFFIFALGIVVSPLRDLFSRLLISGRNMKAPIFSSLLYCLIFGASCAAFVPWIKYEGIAVANVAAAVASCVYLIAKYKRTNREFRLRITPSFLMKTIGSSLGAAALSRLFYQACASRIEWAHAGLPLTLLSLMLGMTLYLVAIKLLGIEEIAFVFDKLASRMQWNRRRRLAAKESSGG